QQIDRDSKQLTAAPRVIAKSAGVFHLSAAFSLWSAVDALWKQCKTLHFPGEVAASCSALLNAGFRIAATVIAIIPSGKKMLDRIPTFPQASATTAVYIYSLDLK